MDNILVMASRSLGPESLESAPDLLIVFADKQGRAVTKQPRCLACVNFARIWITNCPLRPAHSRYDGDRSLKWE